MNNDTTGARANVSHVPVSARHTYLMFYSIDPFFSKANINEVKKTSYISLIKTQ